MQSLKRKNDRLREKKNEKKVEKPAEPAPKEKEGQ